MRVQCELSHLATRSSPAGRSLLFAWMVGEQGEKMQAARRTARDTSPGGRGHLTHTNRVDGVDGRVNGGVDGGVDGGWWGG